MKTMRGLGIGIVCLVLVLFSGGVAWATPFAEVRYMETDPNDGIWEYEYTVLNRSDPVADAGFDIGGFILIFNPL